MPTIITRGAASAKAFGFTGGSAAPIIDVVYATPGSYTWIAPAGVKSVSVLAVGGGGGGSGYYQDGAGGGALAYKNNISITPGNSYTVTVGAGGAFRLASCSVHNGNCGGASSFNSIFTAGGGTGVRANQVCGGSPSGCYTAGYSGGKGGAGSQAGGGGGAAGYAGNGGNGWSNSCPTAGSGGGGGGGYPINCSRAGAGGGVGLFGQGSNGAAGNSSSTWGRGGSGGGCGGGGTNTSFSGGVYGGGAGAAICQDNGSGGNGAVRIIGPGCKRSFPSTCVGASATLKGSTAFTNAGKYTWIAPAGVTSVSVVAVGGGAKGWPGTFRSGGGGALAYANNISVTPGTSYTVVVGAAGSCQGGAACQNIGKPSSFNGTCVTAGGGFVSASASCGGTVIHGTGGNGGSGCANSIYGGGGGGAGGYSGNGGNGNGSTGTGGNGSGGGGGGGSGSGGGGVGIMGQGSNGAGGVWPNGGGGGSGGSCGQPCTGTRSGGLFGGGGAYPLPRTSGGGGAVRIVWPGTTRQFPSTCVGNP